MSQVSMEIHKQKAVMLDICALSKKSLKTEIDIFSETSLRN